MTTDTSSTLKRRRANESVARKSRKIASGDSPSSDRVSETNNEDEDWTGLPTEELGQSDTNTKHTKKSSLLHGLQDIKEASELYRSNSFKLQIDALLPHSRPKASEKRVAPLQRFLHYLHSLLRSLPSVASTHPLHGARNLIKKGVAVPYPLPLPNEETSWKVSFEKPSDILVVGSWANTISVKKKDNGKLVVDLAVEMPDSIFQEKDYLNGRFFHKRAFYIACMASALKESKLDVKYKSAEYDPRLTVLMVQSPSDGSQMDFTKLDAEISIIPVLSPTAPIAIHKISPSFSSIRISSAETTHPPSPIYNTALLVATTPRSNILSVHRSKSEVPAFNDGLTLLRVWANQRGYGYGGPEAMIVCGFESKGPFWEGVLEYLVQGEEPANDAKRAKAKKGVGRGLSSYQLFRAALDFLANWKQGSEGVWVKSKEGHRFLPREYEESNAHEAIFVDSSSSVNLLAGVPLGSLQLLALEAAQTLKTLNSDHQDAFAEVFLTDHRGLSSRFDIVLRVDLSSAKDKNASVHSTIDYGSQYLSLVHSISSLLRRGLGNRVKSATILHNPSSARLTNQAHPPSPTTIFIGLIYNPDNAFRLVEHGPSINETSTQTTPSDFAQLWGEDKAELRRFQDGRIEESVVWDIKTVDEKFHVPALIVQHLLKRHFGINEVGVCWFDGIIKLPANVGSRTDVEKGFKSAMVAFDGLVKAIKAIDEEDMPLSLNVVTPVCEELRYTSTFAPIALASSQAGIKESFQSAMEIVLTFEKSAKWPDDLRAIQIVKLAFMERIASALMKTWKGCRARVVIGRDLNLDGIEDRARLEIITKEGWAFSAKISHDREVTLLQRAIEAKPKVQLPTMVPKEDVAVSQATAVLARHVSAFVHAPAHQRAIAPLHHSHPAFTPTVRLIKRWLASHWLLETHVAVEAVELIVAHLFSYVDVGTKERGFAQTIVFLAQWKWDDGDGLFVPLSTSSTLSGTSGKGVWRLRTETDKEGKVWTADKPDLVAARRIRVVAEATWSYLCSHERQPFDVKTLFVHPIGDYDVLIHLNPDVLPRSYQAVSYTPGYRNLEGGKVAVRPGYDPARFFLDDLRRVYAETLTFFYDPFGGPIIGAIYDPRLSDGKPFNFRVLGGVNCEPTPGSKTVKLNREAIVREIYRMGDGLVRRVETK